MESHAWLWFVMLIAGGYLVYAYGDHLNGCLGDQHEVRLAVGESARVGCGKAIITLDTIQPYTEVEIVCDSGEDSRLLSFHAGGQQDCGLYLEVLEAHQEWSSSREMAALSITSL